jgi:hypothetical protein
MHFPAALFAVMAMLLARTFPKPVSPAYLPVPWPMVKLPRAVWVNRQVLDPAEPEPVFSDSLSVSLPPGKTITPPPWRGISYPPAVKAPVAITLNRRDAAWVLTILRVLAAAVN